jgi:inhibitor of cysteine peptidase
MLSVTLDEAIRSVTVPAGQTIEVTIKENPTTGFHWEIDAVTGPLTLVSSDFAAQPDAVPGRGGKRTIVVRADSRGAGELRLRYERSWQAGSTTPQRRTLAVVIE